MSQQRTPSYRLHKPTGQAVVTLNGRDLYLGLHGTAESKRKYDQEISEWLARGRQPRHESLSIAELLIAYWRHCETYYRDLNGQPTSEQHSVRAALRFMRAFDDLPADEFGPVRLEAVRQAMIDSGLARRNINQQINRIRRMFRWAERKEHVPQGTWESLRTLDGLRAGRSAARETEPVKPVPDAHVEAIKPYLSRQVWAMIEIQRLTGCRPGEVILMRAIDLDTTGSIWTYTPKAHKTSHHGHERTIYLGPRAQQIVKPFMAGRPLDAFLFSPAEAEAERREKLHRGRKVPLSCGNRPGSNRRRRPKRNPGDQYTVTAYRKAIAAACDRAFPPPDGLRPRMEERIVMGKMRRRRETLDRFEARLTDQEREALSDWRRGHRWHPHQLRHSAATLLRKEFGIEAAKVILGHRTLRMTDHYAEEDREKAMAVIGKVG